MGRDETADADSTITHKQRLAIAALVSGKGPTKAAQAANVGRATLFRWRQDPDFLAELRDAEADAWADMTRCVRQLTGEASGRLIRILKDDTTGDGAAIRAALGILALAPRYRELAQLEQEMDELRGLVDGLTGDGKDEDR